MVVSNYKVNVITGPLTQSLETGFSKAVDGLDGAKYELIAYLGSQAINCGTNHAFLVKQSFIDNNLRNVCLMILNEKSDDVGGNTFRIVSIEQVLSDSSEFGALKINISINIPEDAMTTFERYFGKGSGYVGSLIKPFALLGKQMVHGLAYIFAVESTMIISPKDQKFISAPKSVQLVKLYSNFSEVEFIPILNY